jgi:hypothetical protein
VSYNRIKESQMRKTNTEKTQKKWALLNDKKTLFLISYNPIKNYHSIFKKITLKDGKFVESGPNNMVMGADSGYSILNSFKEAKRALLIKLLLEKLELESSIKSLEELDINE